MSRQLQVSKELLIFGDSNIERNIRDTGHFYSQYTDSIPARNVTEFANALQKAQIDKYKTVVFAMFTNIVVGAGSATTQDLSSRLRAVGDCLKPIFQNITLVFAS
jgi:hypothetical protein